MALPSLLGTQLKYCIYLCFCFHASGVKGLSEGKAPGYKRNHEDGGFLKRGSSKQQIPSLTYSPLDSRYTIPWYVCMCFTEASTYPESSTTLHTVYWYC